MKLSTIAKRCIWGILAIIILLIAILCCSYYVVVWNAIGQTFESVDSVPRNKAGLLLGTSPITPQGAHNFYFDNRITAAEELYKSGKIEFIIASGGDYTKTQKNGCDEPQAILDSLVARGIPEERIILDYEGTRTLNSIVKAKKVYGLDSLTLISQKYHNERAIYLADKYGISAIGYNAAPSHIRRSRVKNTIREIFARPKMLWDILTGKRPNIKEDSIHIPNVDELSNEMEYYLNSVKGHKEEPMIIGNFTGFGIDTIYVKEETSDIHDMYEGYKFYAKSSNPILPVVEMYGCGYATPMLVYEGDVDGDGKDEWGYLHTWLNSQWRQYRIYSFDTKSKTWKHLYYGDLLDTPEYVRASGVDIVEKGPKPGYIKINYGTWGVECELRDTIVKATYTPISKDAW